MLWQHSSKANFYVFGISRFTKNNQFKIRSRRRCSNFSFSQVLIYIQKYMVSKPFKKKYNDRKCSHSTLSMPKAKTMTQIRPDDQSKGERKAQSQRQ